MNLAALNLQGVGDVVWDVEVVNGATPAQLVWHERLASSVFGNGAGSASYVGPCDADPLASENTVKVWVVGVYAAAVTSAGSFNSGSSAGVGAVTGSPVAFQNPTTASEPLTQVVTCRENEDAFVHFDVALMRPARQGFFDIAVNFNDIFCSAKFDCCDDANDDGCAPDGSEDLELLFDAGGSRATTMVLGFACTGGASAGAETELYLDALELDCTSPTAGTFAADIKLNPSGAIGNQCAAGVNGMSECTGVVTEVNGIDADTYLYQIGVYRGFEELQSGGVNAQKVYWNVGLGVKRAESGADISHCRLRAQGTAADVNGNAAVDDGVVAAGAVYPFIQWDVDLSSCGSEALSFDDPAAMVRPEYTATEGAGRTFAYAYGRSQAAASSCSPACENGRLCISGMCQCAPGYTGASCETTLESLGFSCTEGTAVCRNDTTGEVFVPAGDFWMGCNAALDPTGCGQYQSNELPQHHVTLSAYAIDATKVTASEYKACVTAAPSGCTVPVQGYAYGTYGTYGVESKKEHPVNYVNWSQASAYCAWSGKAAGAQRLCREAEWEKAARGGCDTVTGPCKTAMRTYPWGNTEPTGCNEANWYGCSLPSYTSAVGTYPGGMSPYGAYDMAGNVSEWVSDWYSAYAADEVSDPEGPSTGSRHGIRGSVYYDTVIRASKRGNYPPSYIDLSVGFRCCRSIP